MECKKCSIEKPVGDFVTGKLICKACWSIDRKAYYLKNKEQIIKQQLERYHNDTTKAKETYLNNKDKFKVKNAEYYQANKERVNKKKSETHKARMKVDDLYRLTYIIRRNIKSSIRGKGYTKKSKTTNILGCSFNEFKTYLESKFEPWMSWNNYGLYNGELNYGWDIDHIIPLASAINEVGIVALNHYTNLQPLCSKINRDIKKNKY